MFVTVLHQGMLRLFLWCDLSGLLGFRVQLCVISYRTVYILCSRQNSWWWCRIDIAISVRLRAIWWCLYCTVFLFPCICNVCSWSGSYFLPLCYYLSSGACISAATRHTSGKQSFDFNVFNIEIYFFIKLIHLIVTIIVNVLIYWSPISTVQFRSVLLHDILLWYFVISPLRD